MAKQSKRKPSAYGKKRVDRRPPTAPESTEGMRLNKYVAHCGVASRREAAEIVKQGHISVNNELVIEPFYQIKTGDIVKFKGMSLS